MLLETIVWFLISKGIVTDLLLLFSIKRKWYIYGKYAHMQNMKNMTVQKFNGMKQATYIMKQKNYIANPGRPTHITSNEQYEIILDRVEELLQVVDNDTPPDNKYSVELELLSNLVADYEEVYMPVIQPTLAEILRLRMVEMGLNQKGVAQLLDVSPSRISEYLNGSSEPTLKVARNMGKKLSIDPHILLGI
jgi:HTH-type transcriptional regulator/antitoxin HigA